MRERLRSVLLAMTRVLPAVGFGRTPEPPTAGIGGGEESETADQQPAMHDQQHVEVPSRAVGKRPRN